MPTFNEISKEFDKINVFSAFLDVMKTAEMQKAIIAIIQRRLQISGTDGNDTKLRTDEATRQPGGGFYSKYTQILKKQKGQITSHVTLQDSGDFYNSMKVEISGFYAEITADFEKQDGFMSENFTKLYPSSQSFKDAILKLTDSELEMFLKLVAKDKVVEKVKQQMK